QDRDAGHGDTPWREAQDERLRYVSPYSFTQIAECRAGSKTCSVVSSTDRAHGRDNGRPLRYPLKLRSKKSTNALALAVAARPVGNTAHRSSAGRLHSSRTARTTPDRSSGLNIHSDAMVSPISASTAALTPSAAVTRNLP